MNAIRARQSALTGDAVPGDHTVMDEQVVQDLGTRHTASDQSSTIDQHDVDP
jgi:hypothetical protein